MNVNDSKVYTDCVEDIDTPLSDICFNEDLYTRPPTVEFTVVRRKTDNKESSDSNNGVNNNNNIVNNSTNNTQRNSSNNSINNNRDISNNNSNISRINANHRDTPNGSFMATNSRQITPEDLNLPDSVWINGRDRQVYVGQKGAAYYLSDNGKNCCYHISITIYQHTFESVVISYRKI